VLRWEGEAWTGREAVWVQSGKQTRIGLWKPVVGIAGARPGAHVHFALTVAEGWRSGPETSPPRPRAAHPIRYAPSTSTYRCCSVGETDALIQTLLEHGLVDEFHWWIFPHVLATGKRLRG
jgi:hypothetical protein